MNKPKIDILLATYNGEKYLEEQLESIINQTFKEWKLYIRDDGSKDKTNEILKKYREKDKRIEILKDGLGNIGVAKNFEILMKNSTAEYIMFCDQDDVWKNQKMKTLYEIAIKKQEDIPFMICSNVEVVDEKLNFLYKTNFSIKSSNIKDYLFQKGGQQGASFIINKALLKMTTPFPEKTWMHDQLLTLNACLFGKIYFCDEYLMLYRQHANNVLGSKEDIFSKLSRIKKIRNPLMDNKRIKFFEKYFNQKKEYLNEKQLIIFRDFFMINSNINLIQKIIKIIKNKFTLRQSTCYLIFRYTLAKKEKLND